MARYNAQIFTTPFLYILTCWLLLGGTTVSFCRETDILCLKSIKESIEDPLNSLSSSWIFENNTEGFICRFNGVECWQLDENVVLNIRLSNMSLQGEFPRGIDKCTSLTGLDLSGNEFYGSIPSDIGKMLPYVTSLDLSLNKFSGEFPSSIANMTFLNVLLLNNNRLEGQIPPQITSLSRLKSFSVANNLLSGPLPNFVNVTFSYKNNEGLCGEPLSRCRRSLKFEYPFKSGFVIGYAVSVVSFIVVFVSYFMPWVDVKKGNRKITIKETILLMMRKEKERRETTLEMKSATSSVSLQEKSQEISTWEKFVTRMSFTELSNATDNFSQDNIIGVGKLGTVYKATLPNGWFLALKRFHDPQRYDEDFKSELQMLGQLRHINLVPLLGFSVESNERLLVYKYMSNGNLYDRLHLGEGEAKSALEWPLRSKIAIGLARGLAWLHHNNSSVHLVHLKLNSKSVLLDHNFEPKISNFRSAVQMQTSEPNSTSSSMLIWELELMRCDVHGFGIVLLELITGKDGISIETRYDDCDNQLSNNSSDVCDAIDGSLIGKGFDAEISQFMKVAYDCVQPVLHQKPTMLEVYNKLMAVGAEHGPTYRSESHWHNVL
ncbi:probably inactive leucine-rich repeat receptor-like protein kinase At5g48380 [Tripterygium wilfordii]|uniref:probably inactive leucine-rich repeat receptor-like protein kinase At5g48380 n=1 Tax=Tripterygium wilfordii TaxID=458696 RepID=UPI0018F848AD|nr:probably inactive leucine-rich repeat receptor-like protein kinase At5g48380 [Tripterygium wilfordii]